MKYAMGLCSFVCCCAVAQQSDFTVTGEVSIGGRQDSNVNVSELDTNSSESDRAIIGKGKLNGKWQVTEKWFLNAGVSHSATHYQTLDEFDLGITTLSASTGYASALGKIGIHHYNAQATLAGEDFMQLQQTGLSWADSILEKGYWRVSADQINKDFDTVNERNAQAMSVRGDAFWFYQTDGFINLSYQTTNEDSVTDSLDYIGHGLNLKLQHPINLFGQPSRFNLAYAYETRDYSAEKDTLFARADNESVVQVGVDIPIFEHLDIKLQAERGNYQSNLANADYEETLFDVSVRAYF